MKWQQPKIRLADMLATLPLGAFVIADVTTSSMEPTLKVGQKVRIIRTDFHSLQVGDIIAFAMGVRGIIMVHRIARVVEAGRHRKYFTKGDNYPAEDELPVLEADFIGLVQS